MQRLYPILDAEAAEAHGHDLVRCARGFAALGLEMQQLRAKQLSGGEFLRVAEQLLAVVPKLIINDRADVALAARAAGVHLGQDDLPAAAARGLGCGLIGLSTHNLAQLAEAAAERPDYLAVGPVFATTTKVNPDPVVGCALVRAARKRWAGPLVAIGGISLENCGEVRSAGADAVAIISGLWATPDPVRAAREFLLAL